MAETMPSEGGVVHQLSSGGRVRLLIDAPAAVDDVMVTLEGRRPTSWTVQTIAT
jgi:hypothetical protein